MRANLRALRAMHLWDLSCRPWFLVCSGVIVHLILAFSVIDIHFQTPIVHGIAPVEPETEAPARRVILIVADGALAPVVTRSAHHFWGFLVVTMLFSTSYQCIVTQACESSRD